MATLTTFPLMSIVRTFGDQTIDGTKLFQGSILAASTFGTNRAAVRAESVSPRFLFKETDVGANLKVWDLLANGGAFKLRMGNDADTDWTDVISISRTDYTSSTTTFTGAVVIDVSLDIGAVNILNSGEITAYSLTTSVLSSGASGEFYVDSAGSVTATLFTGDGGGLTNLNAFGIYNGTQFTASQLLYSGNEGWVLRATGADSIWNGLLNSYVDTTGFFTGSVGYVLNAANSDVTNGLWSGVGGTVNSTALFDGTGGYVNTAINAINADNIYFNGGYVDTTGLFDGSAGYTAKATALENSGATLGWDGSYWNFNSDVKILTGTFAVELGATSLDNGRVITDGEGNLSVWSLSVGPNISSFDGGAITTSGNGLLSVVNFQSDGGAIYTNGLGYLSVDQFNVDTTSDLRDVNVSGVIDVGAGGITLDGNSATLTVNGPLYNVGGITSLDNGAMFTDGAGTLNLYCINAGTLTVGGAASIEADTGNFLTSGTFSSDSGLIYSDGTGLLHVDYLETPTVVTDSLGSDSAGIYLGSPFQEAPSVVVGAGAIPVTRPVCKYNSTGVGQALTLGNGFDGQVLTIVHVLRGSGTGTGVLTPTTKTGFSTITFTNLGDIVTLQYFNPIGWVVKSPGRGVTIA